VSGSQGFPAVCFPVGRPRNQIPSQVIIVDRSHPKQGCLPCLGIGVFQGSFGYCDALSTHPTKIRLVYVDAIGTSAFLHIRSEIRGWASASLYSYFRFSSYCYRDEPNFYSLIAKPKHWQGRDNTEWCPSLQTPIVPVRFDQEALTIRVIDYTLDHIQVVA
jgi:hypothetical protein